MTPVYPQYPPYLPPPPAARAVPTARILAAASGGVALLGLFATFLPVLTVDLTQDSRMLDELGGRGARYSGDISASFGYYDWIVTSFPAVGLIPIVLALAVAAGLLQALRGTSRGAQGATLFLGLAAAATVVLTTIRPTVSVELTGELARAATDRADIDTDMSSAADAVSMGPGLVITVIALLVVVGLNAWPLLANRGQSA